MVTGAPGTGQPRRRVTAPSVRRLFYVPEMEGDLCSLAGSPVWFFLGMLFARLMGLELGQEPSLAISELLSRNGPLA